MRILTICDVLFPQTTGGAGRVARELAAALQRRGHELQFLTRRTGMVPKLDEIPTTYYPPPPRALLEIRNKLDQQFRLSTPDLIHVHQPLAAFLSGALSSPCPVVYTFHSSWPEEFVIKSSSWPVPARRLVRPLLRRIEGQVVRSASAVVVLSQFNAREVHRLYGRKAAVIPGGVDSRRFRPIEQSENGEVMALKTLRNLVPRMGLPELIRAMAQLPEPLHLTIGGEGPLKAELHRLVTSLQLNSRVRLAGHIPDEQLPQFYSGARFFVLPTMALEGFGLVILESLSCGTPVLGTRVGAIPELLERFEAGWLIPEPTAEAIAATVTGVLANPVMSPHELHERVAAEFDWSCIAERYERLFEQVLQ